MDLATDYVVAHRNLAPSVLASGGEAHPNARLAGIDPPRLASLFGILARHRRPYGGPARCSMLTDARLDQCVLLVAPKMVAMLGTAGPLAPQVAAEWSRAGGGPQGGWPVEAAAEALGKLIELAKTARRTESDLLVRLELGRPAHR